MDPSRYARAFGVQSESNKATVTRVASNEIVYRRAVDTYRRDMASKMTNLQREQKRLRRNMRGYRRKLREAQNLPMKRRKPFKVGWIAYDPESSFFDLPIQSDKNDGNNIADDMSKTKEATNKEDGGSKAFHSSKLQDQVEVFLKSVDEHVHNMHLKKFEAVEAEDSNDILYDKNGRRRFLFGSGGIGVSSDALKGLEFELEGYRLDHNEPLSDSSSEDEGTSSGMKSERKVSRRKRPMELIHLNSAYFKPIDLAQDNSDPSLHQPLLENIQNDNEVIIETNGDENVNALPETGGSEVDTSLPSSENIIIKSGETNESNTLTYPNKQPPVQNVRYKHIHGTVNEKDTTQHDSSELHANKSSHKINFGDLIKFKHGLNTKKLFSMVDQLASKYGVSQKENDNENEPERPRGSTRIRAQHNLEPIHESDARSSILYALKHGGAKTDGHINKDRHKISDALVEISAARHDNQHQSNLHLINSHERIRTKPRESLNNDKTSTPDMVDIAVSHSEGNKRNKQLPFLTVCSPATTNSRRQSLDGKDQNRSHRTEATTPNAQPFRSNNSLVNRRKSSILDASNYISNLRSRNNILLNHDKIFGLNNNEDRFGPRRLPAALRKEPGISEHLRKIDDNKVTWSSALGQMKLINTIQDLTHYI